MSGFPTFNLLRLAPIACLLFSASVFAQYEIAPDHDYPETDRAARDNGEKDKARTAVPRDNEASQLNRRIAEQEAVLAEYRAQINAKAEQIEAVFQSLLRTGNEAGEAEAITIYQRELGKLQESLAPAINATEATLARLQAEVATQSQLRMSHPAKHRALQL